MARTVCLSQKLTFKYSVGQRCMYFMVSGFLPVRAFLQNLCPKSLKQGIESLGVDAEDADDCAEIVGTWATSKGLGYPNGM